MLVVSQTHMLRIMEVLVHIIEKCDDAIKSIYSCQVSLLGRRPKVSQVCLGLIHKTYSLKGVEPEICSYVSLVEHGSAFLTFLATFLVGFLSASIEHSN